MGARQKDQLVKIFSISIKCSAILAVTIFIMLEIAGLWYIENKLVVPIGKIEIVKMCFHFAVITFLCTILQIPFTATIFAHEDMGAYASISSVECLLKLLVAFLIGRVFLDNLSFYVTHYGDIPDMKNVNIIPMSKKMIYTKRYYLFQDGPYLVLLPK